LALVTQHLLVSAGAQKGMQAIDVRWGLTM
jgi:hypothetical protein